MVSPRSDARGFDRPGVFELPLHLWWERKAGIVFPLISRARVGPRGASLLAGRSAGMDLRNQIMATVLELRYDPKAVSDGMRQAAEQIRKTAMATNELGKSAKTAGKDVYSLAQDTYKLADAEKVAQKETFNLKKTIDEMVRDAPEGMKRMTQEMQRFKEASKQARAEARQAAGAYQYGDGGGFKRSRGSVGGRSGGAGVGGGAGSGEFVSTLVAGNLGLSAYGVGGEAIKSALPNITRFAAALGPAITGLGALVTIAGSGVTIFGELTKTVHDTADGTGYLSDLWLRAGEMFGQYDQRVREGLTSQAAELKRIGGARLTGTRSFDPDEKKQMAQESFLAEFSTEKARQQRYLDRKHLIERLNQERADHEKKVQDEILRGERKLLRDQETLEQQAERGRQARSAQRIRLAQMEADKLVAIEKAQADRIRANQEARERAQNVAQDQGPLGGLVKSAIAGVDPKEVQRRTLQRRRQLTEDAETYNRFLRDEEMQESQAAIEERFAGRSRRDDGSFVLPSDQREYGSARRAAIASAARNERERNRVSRKEISQELSSPAEQTRATAEVARETVGFAARQAGFNDQTTQAIEGAVTEIGNKQKELDQLSARVDRAMALLQQGSRGRDQRSGRN